MEKHSYKSIDSIHPQKHATTAISKKQHDTRHSPMDMPIMRHTQPQRHKHRKKHTKRSNKNKYELVSQRGISW